MNGCFVSWPRAHVCGDQYFSSVIGFTGQALKRDEASPDN